MSSGFVTETEIAEARQKRQEEWDKVRTADDPLEAPEQLYDGRSLYERLQEQKQRKELEYEEAHKLKNMIKGLDDDEIEFLDLVDRTKLAADRRKNLEEEKELTDYRNRVATLQEQSHDQKLQAEVGVNKPKAVASNRSSQTKLLKGGIVTKSEKRKANENVDESDVTKKVKLGSSSQNGHATPKGDDGGDNKLKRNLDEEDVSCSTNSDAINATSNSGLTCIGILPGLGHYEESSSDECSSNSDQESTVQSVTRLDLLGRKVIKKEKETWDCHKNEKRKANENVDESDATKKVKLGSSSQNGHATPKGDDGDNKLKRNLDEEDVSCSTNSDASNATNNSGLTCIGILPGLGHYEESSSDECSSNSDQESTVQSVTRLDLLGRKVIKKEKETRRHASRMTAGLKERRFLNGN